jgi:hypothetical protein
MNRNGPRSQQNTPTVQVNLISCAVDGVCGEPNFKGPCHCAQHQAKEINGSSSVPESSKTVLPHIPLAFFDLRAKYHPPEAYTLKS